MRQKIINLDARHRLWLSLGAALVLLLMLWGRARAVTQVVAAWDAFALCFVGLAGAALIAGTPRDIHRTANTQDSGRRFVFVFAVMAACASLLAVLAMLRTAKSFKGADLAVHLGLAVTAVAASWLLMHTTFAFRYAHIYYDDENCPDHDARPGDHVGGLEFPGEARPDYLDFAYFSFTIGMTFQVSDVTISVRPIRRLVLLHSMLSFAFNTMILALSLNIMSGLL
jgi:uncharacterized membrane protein